MMTSEYVNWLDPEYFCKILDPDLCHSMMLELDSEEDKDGIIDRIIKCKVIAINMVRYASSPFPHDSVACQQLAGPKIIDLETNSPISLEMLGIDRQICAGSTSNINGREKAVALVTLGLYKYLSTREHSPQILPKRIG